MESKYSKYNKEILELYNLDRARSASNIALIISQQYGLLLAPDGRAKRAFRKYVNHTVKNISSPGVARASEGEDAFEVEFNNVTDIVPDKVDRKEKKGMELRHDDKVVINWTQRTILTDLGMYGSYTCDFDRHNMIQREYVYDGNNETGAIVAMKYDFPHTKAIYVYARIHGFSKASVPQTDLEFELGLDEDEAVEENLQRIKRNVYKKTQKRKWNETIAAADKWWHFDTTVYEKLEQLVGEINSETVPKLESIIPGEESEFAAIIGISDVHYMKLCYNHLGEITYDRKIAEGRLIEHSMSLASEISRYGKPEEIFIIVGNDNLHVDGMHHSTTKLTSQHQATDGIWRLEFKNYVRMQIDMIDYYKQMGPVTLIPVKGNHDYEMSIALQAFLEIHYENDENVNVVTCHDSRTYVQYKDIGIVATHGDELGSIKNLESNIHKLIMGEARLQGLDMGKITRWLLLHGHEHVGSTRDLNGFVQRIGLSSMADIDDWWHKEKGYVGRQNESLVAIIKPEQGRKAILYA